MEQERLGPIWMRAHMDGRAHWPAPLQEFIIRKADEQWAAEHPHAVSLSERLAHAAAVWCQQRSPLPRPAPAPPRSPPRRQPARQSSTLTGASTVSADPALTRAQRHVDQWAAAEANLPAPSGDIANPARFFLSDEFTGRFPPAPSSSWAAIDSVTVLQCLLSPFPMRADVPAQFHAHWATAMADVLEFIEAAQEADNQEDVDRGLKWYLCIHQIFFRLSQRGGRRAWHILGARFTAWQEGRKQDLIKAWSIDREHALQARQDRPAADPEEQRAYDTARALALIEEGELSRGMRLLESTGIAQLTDDVIQQLRRKHPPRQTRSTMPASLPPDLPRVQVHLADTFRALRRQRAPGNSGRRNEYLRALVSNFDDARADSVIPRYEAFATRAANGDMPEWFYHAWCATLMIPLIKAPPAAPGLSPEVRPVGITEVDYAAITSAIYREAAPAAATYLAPQQVAIGVPNGLSILVHGIRLMLESNPHFVCVKIDIRNAYNEVPRAVALHRLQQIPALQPLVRHFHATHVGETPIFTGADRRRLFGDVPPQGDLGQQPGSPARGDSAEGYRQGDGGASTGFCGTTHPELQALDADVARAGGCARAEMDDVYAVGPPEVTFPAVQKYADALLQNLGLVVSTPKLVCFSFGYDLTNCPHRNEVPIGRLPGGHPENPTPQPSGIIVAGVPIGTAEFVAEHVRRKKDEIVSQLDDANARLQSFCHHAWSALTYCLLPRFDFLLQHLPPAVTRDAAQEVDAAVIRMAESCGYQGMLRDDITLRRAQLPAFRKGCGLRSREQLANAAYAASFATAASRFTPRDSGVAFFPMLDNLFGRGAFRQGGHRFHAILQVATPEHLPSVHAFGVAWEAMRADLGSGEHPAGPLSAPARDAGLKHPRRLQHALTIQREEVWQGRLHADINRLPAQDSRRIAWASVDSFSSTWVASWPSQERGWALAPDEFREVFTGYLGLESPAARGLAGREIRDNGGERTRRSDPEGHQVCLATLPGDGWRRRHDAIADVMFRDVLSAGIQGNTEPATLFMHLIPQEDLRADRARLGIIPDARFTVALPIRPSESRAASAPRSRAARDTPREYLFDVKTLSGGGVYYADNYHRPGGTVNVRARAVPSQYEVAAWLIDHPRHTSEERRQCLANPGVVGPVQSALRAYPPVRGLVFGAYGEASEDVHNLLAATAKQAARRQWARQGASSAIAAHTDYACSLRRRWGMTNMREYARLRLSRLGYIGSVGRPRSAQIAGAGPDANRDFTAWASLASLRAR